MLEEKKRVGTEIMNNKFYNQLNDCTNQAAIKFNDNQDYSVNLKEACAHIEDAMKTSSNIAKDAWKIERICLGFDRNISANKASIKISSRVSGCDYALKDLSSLQMNSTKYVSDCVAHNPNDPNEKTAYPKEVAASLRYLLNIKNSSFVTNETYEFYKMRGELLKHSFQHFIKEKQEAFNKHKIPPTARPKSRIFPKRKHRKADKRY